MTATRPVPATSREPRPLRGWKAAIVWLVIVVDLVAVAAAFALAGGDQPDLPAWSAAVYVLIVASFGVVGALVVIGRPRNPVGWLLGQWATALAISGLCQYYAAFSVRAHDGRLPGTVVTAWLSQIGFLPSLVAVIIFIPMVFPDGHLLSRRWRWLVWFEIAALVVSVLPAAFQPGPLQNNGAISNPFGIDAMSGLADPIGTFSSVVLLVIAFPMAIVSAVLRYRRGSVIERLQLRWFAAAAIFSGVWFVAPPVGPIVDFGWTLGITSISLVPVAIGIAIFRYRLYDIDRIISRSIAYAVVTVILAAVFGAAILVSEDLLEPLTGGNTLAVAASTLLVVALFQPLRRRVQRVADRRFNRSHYDAERTVAAFAARLRDDVDLEGLSTDVLEVVARTVSPSSLGLWIRQTEVET